MDQYEILLFYKYIPIADPQTLQEEQVLLCRSLGLTGRMIIAHEGINGTFEGPKGSAERYAQALLKDQRFADMHMKRSVGTGNAFPKLSIKVRDEIVSGHLRSSDVNPIQITGKYITAEQLNDWIKSDKAFYIVDMRNDYEQTSGFFKNSILSQFGNFRDLASILPKLVHLKGKTIVTVCTGGVRCEKASGFLVQNGYADVYQLYGGIVTYMEKYPNEDFLGKLYVFDNRILMGFNTADPKHVVVGRCRKCDNPSENYINCANDACHLHFICCENCLSRSGRTFCSDTCKTIVETNPGKKPHELKSTVSLREGTIRTDPTSLKATLGAGPTSLKATLGAGPTSLAAPFGAGVAIPSGDSLALNGNDAGIVRRDTVNVRP